MTNIIFVCHGSICRSPAAEFIFKKMLKDNNLEKYYSCKSLALSNDALGCDIYPPMKRALDKYGIEYDKHISTKATQEALDEADYVFYMDEENKRLINQQFVWSNKFICLADYVSQKEVDDPWYTGGHELIVRQLMQALNNVLMELESKRKTK